MSDIKINLLPISEIDDNPQNKQLFSVDDIEHLSYIIEEEGFTTPIEVYKKQDGRFEIISGHRRIAAMKMLRKEYIPCYITEDISDENAKAKRLISSNIATRRLTPLELARCIDLYKKTLKAEGFKGETRSAVAKFFNITESSVYRHECLLKLIPELQKYADRPGFPYSALAMAGRLTPEEQKQLYDELISMESSENTDEDRDVTDIVLSRTRIEHLIDNKIRYREKKEQEEKIEDIRTDSSQTPDYSSSEESFPMPEPVFEEPEASTGDDSLGEFIVSKKDNKREVVNIEDVITPNEDSSLLRGIDSCIVTMKGYKTTSPNLIKSDSFKAKLDELKQLIAELEKL